jgi:signal peptidase I
MFDWWKKISSAHRSDDTTAQGELREFLFPKLKVSFFIRMGIVAAVTATVFGVFLMPCVIDGESMLPTYNSSGLTFCKKWSYWFSKPQRGDVVIIKYASNIYLLKRIVALEGDTVEFRNGVLFVNGVEQNEPYVRYLSNWRLKPRKVEAGHCYVVGDNRSQRIHEHVFGQISLERIVGEPLF